MKINSLCWEKENLAWDKEGSIYIFLSGKYIKIGIQGDVDCGSCEFVGTEEIEFHLEAHSKYGDNILSAVDKLMVIMRDLQGTPKFRSGVAFIDLNSLRN